MRITSLGDARDKYDVVLADPPWPMWGVRNRLVRLYGDRPRLEIFAREAVAGWDRYGLEAPA